MKKIFYLTLIALFAAVSCSKEITKTENNVQNVKLNTYTIGATILSDEVKANIDEESLRVLWQVNDRIGLVDAEGNITPATLLADFVGKSSAYFTYEAESPVVAEYAFYPYTETATVTGTTLTTVLPASQNFAMAGKLVCQNNLLMAGKANSEGGVEFKNTCAVVKIAVKGTENYARRLFVQTPDKKISGEGTIDLSSDAPVFTTAAVNEVSEVATEAKLNQRTSYIVINPWNGPDHRLHVTPEGAEEFVYMVVPAGDYTNFCVETLGNTDPTSTEAATAVDLAYTSSKEFTLSVGKIRQLNVTLAMPEGESVVNLTPGLQRANSFLIENKDAKTYIFDTRVGGTNYEDSKQKIVVKTGYYATVLWETTPGLVKNVRYDATNKKISFEKAADKVGNAVIALRARNGKIQWTWHVWVAGETVEARKFGTVEFMDRNLGALAVNSGTVADAGLHYEWGRKDPFPGAGSYAAASGNSIEIYPDVVRAVTAQNGQGISWATALPYVYIWGSKNGEGAEDWCKIEEGAKQDNNMWGNWGTTKPKTIYDPCPYGYRVPNSGAFTTAMINAFNTAAIVNYNKSILDDNGADFYIPTCGYWRRLNNETEMCNIGTQGWLWTMTSSTTNDILNTNYIGAASVQIKATVEKPAVTRKTPRRWGANVRCVKFDENAVNAQ